MKYKFILSLLLLLPFVVFSQQRPAAKEVFKQFYDTYDRNVLDGKVVLFEKKNSNWYVRKYTISDDAVFVPGPPTLFYDAVDGQYLELPFTKYSSKNTVPEHTYKDPVFYHHADLYDDYGYDDWYDVAIDQLSSKSVLTNDELYALAKAYSTRASNRISGQYNFASSKNLFIFPLSQRLLTTTQANAFLKDQDAAIDCYQQLQQKDPAYTTIVGNASRKYANEIMAKVHLTITFINPSLDNMDIPDNLYTGDTLNNYRVILEKCPKQAVLLTHGDNDFYQLLYLQTKKKIRQDVYLLNYNLLASGRFIENCKYPYLAAPAIPFKSDSSSYKEQLNAIVYTHKEETLSGLDSLLTRLKNNNDIYSKMINPTITFSYNNKKRNLALNTQYIYKNEWILLDMLANSNRRFVSTYPFYDESAALNALLVEKNGAFYLE